MNRKRMLVVDDHGDVRLMLRLMLSKKQFEVVEAANGTEAVQALESGGADLVLLDVRLPDMEGWDVLQTIRANPKSGKVPVIVCTADVTSRDSEKARALRHEGFLPKPFSSEQLIAEVDRVMSDGQEAR